MNTWKGCDIFVYNGGMDTYPHISPTLELRLIKKENKKERRLFKFADPFVRRGGARGEPRGGPGAGQEAGQGRAQGRVCQCPSLHPSL